MSNTEAIAVSPQGRVLSVWQNPGTQEKVRTLIPASMSYERFNRLTVSLIHRNPKVAECDPVSFMACISDCATIGVYPDPITGLAYIIPRWNSKKQCQEATLLVGYKGLRAIALRSPDILDLWTGIVRKGDTITLRRAPRQELIHEEDPVQEGEIIGYYSCAALRNGLTSYEYMPAREVAKVKSQALGNIKDDWKKEQSPWTTWEEEMGRKTVLRRHFKSLPLRAEDQEVVQREIDRDEEPINVTRSADGLPAPETPTPAERPKPPARRGGARAAAEQSPATEQAPSSSPTAPVAPPSGSEPSPSPSPAPETKQQREEPSQSAAPVTPPPAGEGRPKHAVATPVPDNWREPTSPAPEAPATPKPPPIAQGIDIDGFFGAAWPIDLIIEIKEVKQIALTPQKTPVAVFAGHIQGQVEDQILQFVTIEGVGLDGSGKPKLIGDVLTAGKKVAANVYARLRAGRIDVAPVLWAAKLATSEDF